MRSFFYNAYFILRVHGVSTKPGGAPRNKKFRVVIIIFFYCSTRSKY